jgi:hypothetical protein
MQCMGLLVVKAVQLLLLPLLMLVWPFTARAGVHASSVLWCI